MSNAYWHPAFMPNSAADAVRFESARQAQFSPTLSESEPSGEPLSHSEPAATPDIDNYETTANNLEDHGVLDQLVAEDNTTHPELANLRNALSTSLASPGGVEMDENPLHSGISKPDVPEDDKADFPSSGPTTESNHLSTPSFARTVSKEMNWGEDGDFDSGWDDLMDNDPFKRMTESNRTNSFPQVPPTHTPGIKQFAQSLPHSQVGDILTEVETTLKDVFGYEENTGDGDFFAQQAVSQDVSQGHLGESQTPTLHGENYPSTDTGLTYSGTIPQENEQELEARYEEGIPLVESPEDQNIEQRPAVNKISTFLEEDPGDAEDFFAQVSKSSDGPEVLFPDRQGLARKSTMQVMDSLQLKPREDNHNETDGEWNIESSQDSVHNVSSSGLEVSMSSVLSSAGDAENEIEQAQNLPGLETDSGDIDLAAKWEAALAGDEFLDDEDLLGDEEQTDTTAVDPATFFGSDDEGFLEDIEDQNASTDNFREQLSPPVPSTVVGHNGHMPGFDTGGARANGPSSSSSRYLPASTTTALPTQSNSYTPSGPLLTDLSKSAMIASAPSPYLSPVGSFPNQQQQEQRPDLPKAQSFADKSKGGYASPYDLPMDVVKPRKRVSMQQMSRGYNISPTTPSVPPPRSISMNSQPPPSRGSTSSLTPPSSSQSLQKSQLAAAAQPKPAAGFFEDLPVSTKPKLAARLSSGLTAAASTQYSPPINNSPAQFSSAAGRSTAPAAYQATQGLIAPERVSPYASLPSNTVPVPSGESQYSPAPIQPHSQMAPPPPVSQSRYSPAPPPNPRQQMPAYASPPGNATAPPQPTSTLPYQPRTSSPLAHFERSQDARPYSSHVEALTYDRRSSSSGHEPSFRSQHLPPTREVDENENTGIREVRTYGELPKQHTQQSASQSLQGMRSISQTPPPSHGLALKTGHSPPKRATSSYLPQQHPGIAHQMQPFVPPQRSQTQSPGTAFAGSRFEMGTNDRYERPASVEPPSLPRSDPTGFSSIPMGISHGRPRGLSQGLNYIAPNDGRENDPLQRWKGAPVFAWGVGGTIITSFPKDIPRYGMNQSTPMIVRSPGEVKVRNIRDVDPLEERLTSFPGPLKGKSKKKEILSWLSSGVETLEQRASYLRSLPNLSHEDKRTEERVLLWKILRIFIEYDGTLEGNALVDQAVRAVLSPALDEGSLAGAPQYSTVAELRGISQSSASVIKADSVDPVAVDQLRLHLLRGQREKAVWEAVDKRLWGHAMLISNTVSKDLYKRVAQEFVQKEVKNLGDNTESLAALYEIFAGNFEESMDELVPPSARAGFQMVSTSRTVGQSKDALDGLDRWRETLGLVLSNRSNDDSLGIDALGKLLSGYGRAEAAHTCFLFARNLSGFGGIDDPQANMVLVGSDHLRQPFDFDQELDPILLSEVYEYGLSLSSPSNTPVSGHHLAVYKLHHATILAEYGYREKALQYCEAIAASVFSQTRRSPYHHTLLVAAVDDLSKRLKESPKDETSSWISKPSIDKVSGSVWATFNKFVAGDENDNTASGTVAGAGTDIGPFARIAGGTPIISRSPSNSDIYGSYGNGPAVNGTISSIPITKASSRYAPAGPYSPPSSHDPPITSPYGSQPQSSLDERTSGEHRRGLYEPQTQVSDYHASSPPANSSNNYTPKTSSSYASQSSYPPYINDFSNTETVTPYAPHSDASKLRLSNSSNNFSSPQPLSNFHDQPTPISYAGEQPYDHRSSPAYSQPTGSGYEPPTIESNHGPPVASSYEPPTTSSYEPLASNGYESPASNAYEPPASNAYEPPSTSSYEPPSTSGYEPPSHDSIVLNDEFDSPINTRPKKSFMDDDGDDDVPAFKATPEAGEKSKAEKDREADEAFRKAAEADAKKDVAQPKKGWGLGGWFGGGKKDVAEASQPNKPIRAKLGEASSFVYDPELKRWINKKGGGDSTPSRAETPPPPKSGPPRVVSGPPSGGITSAPRPPPPQRVPSFSSESSNQAPKSSGPPSEGFNLAAVPAMSRSQSNGSMNGPPSSGPPSRPATSMSNASSIDDLLGPATGGRKGTARKAKKGRGYIDLMGEKAS